MIEHTVRKLHRIDSDGIQTIATASSFRIVLACFYAKLLFFKNGFARSVTVQHKWPTTSCPVNWITNYIMLNSETVHCYVINITYPRLKSPFISTFWLSFETLPCTFLQTKETQRINGLTEIVALRIGIPLKAAWSLVNIHQINQQLRIQRLSHYNPRIQLLREEFPVP